MVLIWLLAQLRFRSSGDTLNTPSMLLDEQSRFFKLCRFATFIDRSLLFETFSVSRFSQLSLNPRVPLSSFPDKSTYCSLSSIFVFVSLFVVSPPKNQLRLYVENDSVIPAFAASRRSRFWKISTPLSDEMPVPPSPEISRTANISDSFSLPSPLLSTFARM